MTQKISHVERIIKQLLDLRADGALPGFTGLLLLCGLRGVASPPYRSTICQATEGHFGIYDRFGQDRLIVRDPFLESFGLKQVALVAARASDA
jgi:hypothetical protein